MLLSCTVAAGALSIPAVPAAYFVGILKGTDYLASAFAVLGCTLTAALRLYALLNDAPESTAPTADSSESGAASKQESDS